MHGRHIDLGDPVNDHPDNDGLVLWLPSFPPFARGGSLWRDVTKGRAHGTLTSGPVWRGVPRPGRVGVLFDGSNDSVVISGSTAAPTGGSGAMMWCAFSARYADASQNGILIQRQPVNDAWLVMLEGGSCIVRGTGGTEPLNFTAPAANVAHRFYLTWKNTVPAVTNPDIRLYVDGALADSATSGDFATGTTQIDVGRGNDFAGYPYAGLIWDLRIGAGRLPSAAEAHRDWQWSMGRPEDDPRVRTFSRRVRAFGSGTTGGGGGTAVPVFRRHYQLMQTR